VNFSGKPIYKLCVLWVLCLNSSLGVIVYKHCIFIFQAFQEHGEIKEGYVIYDKVTRTLHWYGYITYKHMISAHNALSAPIYRGVQIQTNTIKTATRSEKKLKTHKIEYYWMCLDDILWKTARIVSDFGLIFQNRTAYKNFNTYFHFYKYNILC
jgi:hypothetical protein